ncbi:hypothetical protein AB0J86_27865 [Micromonospora sp. NPDC049559]|uniref:hypothetical protein n=1 Tax=Micromonospora sp. NPDC049559 TaxID=3155923 RepID=UPI003416811D
MKARKTLLLVGLIVAAAASTSGGTRTAPTTSDSRPTRGPERPATPYGADVLDLAGLPNVEFGDTEQELTQRGVLGARGASCASGLNGMEAVSPVFDHDRLVLLWADPPVRTPEGVTIGTPVSQVRATYPALTRLTAPRGTYRFDGLLARDGDRAYLFLHDGRTVRKTVAGYAEYARRLFDEGFGTC